MADRLGGEIQLTRERLDLRSVLDEVVADGRFAAERNQVGIMLDVPETLPFTGAGDCSARRSAT
jgi:hypothetical protein